MNDFGRLLEKEIARLRRYARALTRDRSRADDLVQDVLVRVIANQRRWQRAVRTFAPGSSPLCITRMSTTSDAACAKASPLQSAKPI
ncbi:MAG: sigma factor [Stellaceae bacterium]